MLSRRVEMLLDYLRQHGIADESILRAISLVPREQFVDEAF